jgi:plasmid stability protein
MRKEYNFSRGKRGPVIKSPGKTRITIMIDDDVIEGYRAKAEAAGRGYQTLMNEILRAALAEDDRPVTAKMLRKILREELHTPWRIFEVMHTFHGRRWADDLATVIELSHARNPVLVGWSLGGAVISNYLAAYGDGRIGGAVYVDGVVELSRTRSLQWAFLERSRGIPQARMECWRSD